MYTFCCFLNSKGLCEFSCFLNAVYLHPNLFTHVFTSNSFILAFAEHVHLNSSLKCLRRTFHRQDAHHYASLFQFATGLHRSGNVAVTDLISESILAIQLFNVRVSACNPLDSVAINAVITVSDDCHRGIVSGRPDVCPAVPSFVI